MKKKLLAALLCAVLALLILPQRSTAAQEIMNFVVIDDQIPMELINCITVNGGTIYVPSYVISNYGLGIAYSYFSGAATAYFSTEEKQLFFEMDTGRTYDGSDNSYAGSALSQNGVVYVPLYLMQGFFGGFDYSFLTGSEYGNILRITTGAAVLSDAEFLRAAQNTMRIYYDLYYHPFPAEGYPPEPTPVPAVTPASRPAQESDVIVPTQRPEASAAPTHAGERLLLGFAGLPADRVLTALAQDGIRTCFFLTAEDVRSAPDLVRRLVGEGHSAGIRCTGPDLRSALEEASALLFEAARVRTVLVAASEEEADACRALAQAEDLVFCGVIRGAGEAEEAEEPPAAFDAAALVESAAGQPLLPDCSAFSAQNIVALLRYLDAQQYDIACPRETEGQI